MMEIKIYVSQNIPWCKKLKTWLKRRKLSFQELDVDESDTYRDEVLEKTGQLSLPVTDIDGKIVIGFDEEELTTTITEAKNKTKEESKEIE